MIKGYIVSDKPINNILPFIKVITHKEATNLTTNDPVLYIGYKKAKKLDGFVDIFTKKIGDNKYWTFNRTEKRSSFMEDIENFQKIVINNIINNLKYIYINPCIINYNILKILLKYFKSLHNDNIYIQKGMLYFASKEAVYGISLLVLKYCKVNIKKRLTELENSPHINIFREVPEELKTIRQYITNKEYAVAYFINNLHKIKNEPKE